MGEEKPAEWYTGKGSQKHIKKYMPLYLDVFGLIKENIGPGNRIVEMGCGIGTLAKLLFANNYKNYLGFDFSSDMIEISKNENPNQLFMQFDLRDADIKKYYTGCSHFICLEVLEHIKDDFAVLNLLPKGAMLFFSLPTNDAKAHVRWFKKKEAIYDRYSSVINIQSCQKVGKWHLCKGIIK